MIDKKEDTPSSPDAAAILSQTCQYLESKALQVQSEVRSSFASLHEALLAREKQLLRQIDVARNQQLSFIQAKTDLDRVPVLKLDMESDKALQEAIASLGSVTLEGAGLIMLNGDGSFLQSMEDYQDAIADHMAMFKPVPLAGPTSPRAHETVIRFNHINLPSNQTETENNGQGCRPVVNSGGSKSLSPDVDPKTANWVSPTRAGSLPDAHGTPPTPPMFAHEHLATHTPLSLNISTATPISQESVIRFNHLNVSHASPSESERCQVQDSTDEIDSSPAEQEKDDKCGEQDADVDKSDVVQTSAHPAQVQQWLKQLSAETETEPSVGEPKNFGPL